MSAPVPSDANDRAIRRVVLLTLALNILVAAAKGAYAAWSGSLAVASDAIHSLIDGSSNVIGLVALRMAASPADARHPYGHRKIEIVAAVGIGVAIGGATIGFAWRAVQSLLAGGHAPVVSDVGFVVILATLVSNVFVAVYEHRAGKRLGSHFLVADALHTASDVLVTLGVLASLIAVRAGWDLADPLAALAVTVVIGRVAWRIIGDNLDILLDRAALSVDEVSKTVLETPGVVACHRIRSRGVPGQYQLDLHIHLDGALTLTAAHAISHVVEARLAHRFPGLVDVTIHVEPAGDRENE